QHNRTSEQVLGTLLFRKVLVEKSRRDRINGSIEQMRALFHPATQTREENGDFRLDKAAVLEIAVSFLRHKAFSRANSNYARGFSHCLQETLRHVTLHARLQPKATEAVQRFYVRQRSRLTARRGCILGLIWVFIKLCLLKGNSTFTPPPPPPPPAPNFCISQKLMKLFTVVVMGTRRPMRIMPPKPPSQKDTTLYGYEYVPWCQRRCLTKALCKYLA
uniref:BHLH domain-containing protein n=1 Tax=Pygocentrus nattereri TaxID=42514 RepID=A0AAR2JH93_PYGNA